jgi:hypothetical protein
MEIPMAIFYKSISDKKSDVVYWYSGKDINAWNVIIGDLFYVLCGLMIVYSLMEYYKIEKKFWKFMILFLTVQIIGDLIFAFIISIIPNFNNTWIKFFKKYVGKGSLEPLFGDSLYIIVWTLTFIFVNIYIKDIKLKLFILFLFLFLISIYSSK